MAGFSRPNMTYMAGTWLKTPVNSFLETNSRPVFYFVYFIVLFYYFFIQWSADIPISLPSQIFQVNIWWSYSHLGFTGIRTKALCLLIVPKQHFFLVMANEVSACRKEIEEPGSQEKVNSVIKARDTPFPFYFVEVEKCAFYSYVKADEDLPSKYFCTTK